LFLGVNLTHENNIPFPRKRDVIEPSSGRKVSKKEPEVNTPKRLPKAHFMPLSPIHVSYRKDLVILTRN